MGDIVKKDDNSMINDKEYFKILNDIKNQIKIAQRNATVKVNTEFILMNYRVGRTIAERNIWGSKFIETLSKDLRLEFPDCEGFSATNLRYMQKFAKEYSEEEILHQGVGELAWRSNILLMDKVKDREERFWYVARALENSWGRVVLDHQIATRLIDRQADNTKKVSNYMDTVSAPHNERVLDMLKDPYLLENVEFRDNLIERQIEKSMIADITKLIMELGNGFAFKGNQYHIKVGEKDYYMDMLFFNTELNCFVVVELKNDEFKPEFAGQLGFYVEAVNEKMKKDYNNDTVGILLCRGKDNESTRISLKAINSPVGVAEYKFMQEIPEYIESVIPKVEDIESRLNDIEIAETKKLKDGNKMAEE